MKAVTQLLLIILLATLLACNGSSSQVAAGDGGMSGTGTGGNKSSISGAVYKGPIIQDSLIKLFKISNGILSTTAIETKVLSNKGDYSSSVDNGIYSLQASGRYYDETNGNFSTDSTELKATANIVADGKVFINILTHLAHDYTVSLMKSGDTYDAARAKAKARTLEILKPVTGEATISSAFNQIGLTLADNANGNDIAYLGYLSALLIQSANEQASLSVNSLLNTLAEDVSQNTVIDDSTLSVLVEAHANLDETAINQNINFIFNTTATADISATVINIDTFNSAPGGFSTALAFGGVIQRFFFDGSFDDGGAVGGMGGLSDGVYGIQISKFSNFSTLEINTSGSANWRDIPTISFVGAGMRYARIRKIHNNGQVGQWSAVVMFNVS